MLFNVICETELGGCSHYEMLFNFIFRTFQKHAFCEILYGGCSHYTSLLSYSRETYIDCSYIVRNVFEKKFFKRAIYAAIDTSLDSVLDADSGDIIFIVICFELKEFLT